ncbi:ribonuclease HII, partial [Lacticaseibacillus rhamnosus MTCC 5462]
MEMYSHVAGLDEVGRGPLAGPVVTAAVILPHQFKWPVNDSKQLTAHERDVLYPHILTEAIAVGIGVADNHEIDREYLPCDGAGDGTSSFAFAG